MTQEQFALTLGFSSGIRISEYETGRLPIPYLLRILLILLDKNIITIENIRDTGVWKGK